MPLVESWPLSISYREGNAHHTCSLHSDARLNLVVTPASFRSLGDLYCFSKMVTTLPDAARRSIPSGLARGLTRALAQSRQRMSTLYRSPLLPSLHRNLQLQVLHIYITTWLGADESAVTGGTLRIA